MGLLIRSVFVGILSAVVTCVFAFALAPWFDAVGLLIAPAAILVSIICPIMPSIALYSLVPDGGAPAGVLLVLGSALFFWVVIFGAMYYILISLFSSSKGGNVA